MTISLGCESPRTSCSLPEAADLAIQEAGSYLPMGLPLLDLAPGGGYLAVDIAAYAGGLLHHHFTLTFHRQVECGMFLWPIPSGCPVPGITRHLALWSADFPRWYMTTAVIRLAWEYSSYHSFNLDFFYRW
jgi:hypothetical protein